MNSTPTTTASTENSTCSVSSNEGTPDPAPSIGNVSRSELMNNSLPEVAANNTSSGSHGPQSCPSPVDDVEVVSPSAVSGVSVDSTPTPTLTKTIAATLPKPFYPQHLLHQQQQDTGLDGSFGAMPQSTSPITAPVVADPSVASATGANPFAGYRLHRPSPSGGSGSGSYRTQKGGGGGGASTTAGGASSVAGANPLFGYPPGAMAPNPAAWGTYPQPVPQQQASNPYQGHRIHLPDEYFAHAAPTVDPNANAPTKTMKGHNPYAW